LLTSLQVLVGAGVALLVAIAVLIYIRRTPSATQSRVAILSVVAGFFLGITTNVGTYYLIKDADQTSDTVSINPIRDQVMPGVGFAVSGRANVVDDHELWVVIYRPYGGFDIANRSPLPIASDGTWIFSSVVAGRPPAQGLPSPDSRLTYNVSAVIVDVEGADALEQAVESVSDPNAGVFVNGRNPLAGVVASSTMPVTLP